MPLSSLETPVVTAFSVCSALGPTTSETVDAYLSGRSGLAPPRVDLPFVTVVGAVAGGLDALPPSLASYDTRAARIVMRLADECDGAVRAAVRRWGADRVGVVLGTSSGGLDATEAALATHRRTGALPVGYDLHRRHAFGATLELLAKRFGHRGAGVVVSTACSSSGKAFASAHRLLRAGVLDAVLVGGIETLCQTTLRGFHGLGILSERGCRPFAVDRDGTTLGEGGALFLLEREGTARARLLGVGESLDGYQMSAPHPEGLGARESMERALAHAGIEPSRVGFVLAHGTGTPQNDSMECRAINQVFGMAVPVASTKAMTGHALGAAGAIGAALAMITLEHGWLPPSLGADPLDQTLRVDIVRDGRISHPSIVLSNSFGFGGSNVSVLLGVA